MTRTESPRMSHARRSPRFVLMTLLGVMTCALGCRTTPQSPAQLWGIAPSSAAASEPSQPEPIQQTSGESDAGADVAQRAPRDRAQSNSGEATSEPTSESNPEATSLASQFSPFRIPDWMTGRSVDAQERGKTLYQEGDALFRQAETLPREEAQRLFTQAAKQFKQASNIAPDSALGQDAQFMLAESQFFADRLTDAAESYQKLQKDYPRNRHADRAAARLFNISRYWIETEKASGGSWIPNLTDSKRPKLDVEGHAVRVLDQIRFDDPTGRLADDATMAAAAEFIRQEKYDEADEFLTDLRETYTDSDHLFLAHLLGIQCKLELYVGPEYSNLLLDEADKLVKQTRTRFPDRLREQKYADILARAAARISYHKAEKLFTRAQYRDKRHEYRAAAKYYQALLDQHGKTPFAETARERLTEIADRPAVPVRHLSFLTKIFNNGARNSPLELAVPEPEPSEESVLR